MTMWAKDIDGDKDMSFVVEQSERALVVKDKVQLKGFRPGKVPVAHLRKMYGKSLMAEMCSLLSNLVSVVCSGSSVYRPSSRITLPLLSELKTMLPTLTPAWSSISRHSSARGVGLRIATSSVPRSRNVSPLHMYMSP